MDHLLTQVRACRVCADLPLGPRPVLSLSPRSRILVIGQAPGTKVHASGVAWDDDSGLHLKEWLGVDDATFRKSDIFGIVPMGFCYPGKKSGGDLPPRAECAPLWHARLIEQLPNLELTLLIGQYAQKHYLGRERKKNLTETVRAFEDYLPTRLPLPHPSWRSRIFRKKQPWFDAELLPVLRSRIDTIAGQPLARR